MVDRRFNRARYNAEAVVAAFTTRLRQTVDLDTAQDDLIDTFQCAFEPAHASVRLTGMFERVWESCKLPGWDPATNTISPTLARQAGSETMTVPESATTAGVEALFVGRSVTATPRGAGVLPRGWYLPYGGSTGVAGGLVVESGRQRTRRTPSWRCGIRGRALKVIGRDMDVMAAYTPPGYGRDGLASSARASIAGPNLD